MCYGISHIDDWNKILDKIEVLSNGDIIKAIAWKIEKSKDFPEGIKYAFAYIHEGKRILGYDNERAKGHHKHIRDLKKNIEIEIPIKFKDPFLLFKQFKEEVKKLLGGKNES